MALIICEDSCNKCGLRFRKDPLNSGDYSEGGVLLRFCPDCGQMLPYLNIVTVIGLSRTVKKTAAIRIAKRHQLDYKKVLPLIEELKEITARDTFVKIFMERLKDDFDLDVDKQSVLNIL